MSFGFTTAIEQYVCTRSMHLLLAAREFMQMIFKCTKPCIEFGRRAVKGLSFFLVAVS